MKSRWALEERRTDGASDPSLGPVSKLLLYTASPQSREGNENAAPK